MTLKILLLSAFVFYLATQADGKGNLNVGNPFGSELIYHKKHEKSWLPFMTRDEVIEVNAMNNQLIRAVKVQDIKGDGMSYMVGGGIGHKSVSIKLESKRNHGYSFLVEVFAF